MASKFDGDARRTRRYVALCNSTRALVAALAERDTHTREHADRVIQLADQIGRACDLTEEELLVLRLAAALHDIGKIGIPDHILLKPGTLNPDEWTVMRTHPERGARILRASGLTVAEPVAAAVSCHHEHFDGSGYPRGLRGTEIPMAARIVLVADAYDAMASPRPYHRSRQHTDVMRILEGDVGVKSDPDIFSRFARLVPVYAPS